jgi:hypothetical protein
VREAAGSAAVEPRERRTAERNSAVADLRMWLDELRSAHQAKDIPVDRVVIAAVKAHARLAALLGLDAPHKLAIAQDDDRPPFRPHPKLTEVLDQLRREATARGEDPDPPEEPIGVAIARMTIHNYERAVEAGKHPDELAREFGYPDEETL